MSVWIAKLVHIAAISIWVGGLIAVPSLLVQRRGLKDQALHRLQQGGLRQDRVEVVALLGNYAMQDDQHRLHPHVVVSKRDGSALGGHLLEGVVRPTLEVIVVDDPAHLRRRPIRTELWPELGDAAGQAAR